MLEMVDYSFLGSYYKVTLRFEEKSSNKETKWCEFFA